MSYFYSASKLKVNSYIKIFIENQQSNSCVRNGSFNEMLTSKNRRVSLSSELFYTRLQQPHEIKKRFNLE